MEMTVTRVRALAIFKRDGYTCHYCEGEIIIGSKDPRTQASIDHKHPKAKGGSDRIGNLVASCAACNNEKGDMLYAVYLWYREMRALGYEHDAIVDLILEVEDDLMQISSKSTNGKPWVGSVDVLNRRTSLLRSGKKKAATPAPVPPPPPPPPKRLPEIEVRQVTRGANGGVICPCCTLEFATAGDVRWHRMGHPVSPLYKSKFNPAPWRGGEGQSS